MNNWIKTKDRLPPQGQKILCFDKGDVSIRQRFGKYWFPIPYTDSEFADIDPQELWKEIDFPEGFNGKCVIKVECEFTGKLKGYTIDELEQAEPEIHAEMCQTQKEYFDSKRKKDA